MADQPSPRRRFQFLRALAFVLPLVIALSLLSQWVVHMVEPSQPLTCLLVAMGLCGLVPIVGYVIRKR
jgi:hypothetical protein